MRYDQVLASAEGVVVVEEVHFDSMRIKGLCVGRNIAINSRLETSTEKLCVLAEELGHFFTTAGNILDQSKLENRKQEARAREWAYEFMIRPDQIVAAYHRGIGDRYELAEYLGVTECFLDNALSHFEKRYWPRYRVGEHVIVFRPLRIERM